MREARGTLVAGLLLAALAAVGSCRDQAAPEEPGDPPPAIVSNPVMPTVAMAAAGSAASAARVAYVSFRPGTFPDGVAATMNPWLARNSMMRSLTRSSPE